MFRLEESAEVHTALVAELAHTVSPTTVMGLTILIFGLFSYATADDPNLLIATAFGTVASFVKVIVMHRQRRTISAARATIAETRRWEWTHASVTGVVAASVASLSILMFNSADLHLHMLAAALLLGYSAGVASRVSVRPLIAAGAITIAAIPTICAAAMVADAPHRILAAMFTIFFVAGVQSVWHVYTTAKRQIVLALEMAAYARRDSLTGLPNRFAMRESFQSSSREQGTLTGVHCFDLDGFKAVNDRLGHTAGDALLQEISVRLSNAVVEPNVAARVGGDEFVVIQFGVRTPEEATAFAHAMTARLVAPYSISGEDVIIGVSLGFTLYPAETANLDDMIRLADAASYRAKRSGGGVSVELPEAAGAESHPSIQRIAG